RAAIPQPARAFATRTREAEPHRSRHLFDMARAVALGTRRIVPAPSARAITNVANFLPRDVEPHLRALDRLPEVDIQTVFEIAALLRGLLRTLLTPEPLAEDVLKIVAVVFLRCRTRPSAAREVIGEIETTEAGVRASLARSAGHAYLRVEA